MKEFDKAAENEKSLSELMADFGDRLQKSDNEHKSYGFDALMAAGYYLNTVWPLKRNEPEDCWDTAYRINDFANGFIHYWSELADGKIIESLYAKAEKVLREGVERFPSYLRLKDSLADCIISKNNRNKTDCYDEAVDLLLQIVDALDDDNPDHDDIESEYILWTTYLGSAGEKKLEGMEMPQWAKEERERIKARFASRNLE
jgi:hypothetical protein